MREPVQIIAEVGINYCYGPDESKFIDNAKKLIDICAVAGVSAVKLQKRDPDSCVPDDQKDREKIVPWRDNPITYLQYKKDIEFGFDDYTELFSYCSYKDIEMFASVWDIKSADFMCQFTDTVKIPSAKLTDWDLLEYCKELYSTRILSTGMSTEKEIEKAVKILDPHVIMHTNSVYPTPIEDLNLEYIKWLKEKYPSKKIGFSSHYYGILPLMASIYLGIDCVEFHVTLDHSEFGSDQLSSVEPSGIFKVVKGIRDLEKAIKKGYGDRSLYRGEAEKKKVLRGV